MTHVSLGYDYVFLDVGAGVSDIVLQFNVFAARNFVIVSRDLTSVADAYAMMKTICRTFGKESFEIIVNSVRDDEEGLKVFNHIDSICKRFLNFSPRYLGFVPFDEAVTRSIMKQAPLVRLFPNRRPPPGWADRRRYLFLEGLLKDRSTKRAACPGAFRPLFRLSKGGNLR